MDLKEESKTERVAGKLAICSFENIQIKKTVILKGLSSKFYVTLDSQPRRIEYKEGAIGFAYTLMWRFWTAEELFFA